MGTRAYAACWYVDFTHVPPFSIALLYKIDDLALEHMLYGCRTKHAWRQDK